MPADVRRPVDEAALDAAASALAAGALVVLPTDTVYGVAARPDLPGATDAIFAAKRRPRDLTLPLLAPDLAAAREVARFDERAALLAERFWPGALTVVLPRTDVSAAWDLGEERVTIGVRVPSHPIAAALLERTGVLAVTSANRSGEPTPPGCEGVVAALGETVSVYLCAPATGSRASTVVDLAGDRPVVLREGEITRADIEAVVGRAEGGR